MLSKNAETLLQQRYYKPAENWESLVRRNVDSIMEGNYERKKESIYNLIKERVFLPNSPSLVNAGYNNGLFACFTVGPTEDTLEDSFNTLRDIALIAKAGGGCGFTGSILRPKNAPVAGSAHGYAYGPNRFAELTSFAMDAITQSGFRKMALMYTLSAEHPDIEEFINLKQGDDELACYNFNQSVMVTDSWMQKAINPDSVESRLLDKIARHAWNNGEPGLLFETTLNQNSPYWYTGQKIYCTNPCGEQPLPPYGSCNLASINLNHACFFNDDLQAFDYITLRKVVREMVWYLDAVGTKNRFPTDKHYEWYQENRPIGIGIMGLADLFLRLGLRYGSEESLELLDIIFQTIYYAAEQESEKLSEEFYTPPQCEKLPEPRRNITLLSIAPTGSIAIIGDCSHGIEPIFSPTYRRVDERGQEYIYVHPDANKEYFVSAVGEKQPTWKEQIDLVAVCQAWVDSGVSKTINFPNSATVNDIKEAYIYAWQKKLKGITIYRDGSRNVQVLNSIPQETESNECPTGVCEL